MSSNKGKEKSIDFLQDMLNAVDDPSDDIDMLDQEFDPEGFHEIEDEDETDIDKEDLDEFMNDDEFMQDHEITELLNKTTENRKKFKIGDREEMAQAMEDFDASLALTTGIGSSKISKQVKKKLMVGETRLPPEVKQRLGIANSLYIKHDYGAAINLLQEIITEYPNAHQAWNTLGLVHEEMGNPSKSMQLRMMAAHMCQESSLWKELGQKSVENDAIKQAIYCFSKALTIDPTDVDALWDRSFLYKQLARNKDAIQGFQSLLLLMPHHFKVINELAQLYRGEGKTKEAIELYENAIVYHNDNEDEEEDEDEDDGDDEFLDKLGNAEINMLSELYLMQNDYRRSLDTIKTGLRHVQHRQNETWWQDTDNDDEYFGDDESRTEFPIELRIRMGVCRVYLGKVDLATKHFEYLLRYPPTTYPDLHQDIAYAYFDRRHYDLALNVFQKIIDAAQEVDVDILIRMGDCHREVGDLEAAIVFYVNVLDEYPDNLDVMMSLATVYEEQGKEEEALELVEYVMKKNREARRQKKKETENQTEAEISTQDNTKPKSRKAISLFHENSYTSLADQQRDRRAAKLMEFEEKTLQIEGIFQKLEELDADLPSDLIYADRSLIRDYMRTAQEAWDDFRTTPAFYPSTRQRRYEGFYAIRRQKPSTKYSVEREARQMANRLRVRVKAEDGDGVVDEEEQADKEEEDMEMKDEEERENQLRSADHFRNIPFDKWLRLIVRYAYMLALSKRQMDSYEVLKRAADANVFYQHDERIATIKIALMGCGFIGGTELMVLEGLRWICNTYRFKHDPFPIYIAFLECGFSADYRGSANTPSMKYLARNIRLIDALIANKKKTEEENDDNAEDDQPGLDEIKELDDAILTMNIEPSSVSDQNMNRFYSIPPDISNREYGLLSYDAPDKPSPILLSAFGHLLTLSKNHLGASLFFMRSYGIDPTNPVNTLCLGLSLIYTAMQRKSDNRHMQIMQGMMFMTEYTKLAGFNQETEFNMARIFHTLGLSHLAVPHYENVLRLPSKKMEGIEDPKPLEEIYLLPEVDEDEIDDYDDDEEEEEDYTDLKREAAYNLHLIYVNSGAMTLAQIVLLKYCTI